MRTVTSPWFSQFEIENGRFLFLWMVGEKVPRVTPFLDSFASEHGGTMIIYKSSHKATYRSFPDKQLLSYPR